MVKNNKNFCLPHLRIPPPLLERRAEWLWICADSEGWFELSNTVRSWASGSGRSSPPRSRRSCSSSGSSGNPRSWLPREKDHLVISVTQSKKLKSHIFFTFLFYAFPWNWRSPNKVPNFGLCGYLLVLLLHELVPPGQSQAQATLALASLK